MATPPPTARRHYAEAAAIAAKAARDALKVRTRGLAQVARVVITHQIAQAQLAELAVEQMLAEQQIEAEAEALLNSPAFTTDAASLGDMLEAVETDREFERLVASIVQDAARAAESVAVTARPRVYHVRLVNPPCCSRCAILAGRVYPWSTGFLRHPGCDCSMIPTTVASELWQDPEQLVEDGQVTGLSRADVQALADGGDLNRIVNVRKKAAGLLTAGHALTREGKPTPAGIYRRANGDRELALRLLRAAGYVR